MPWVIEELQKLSEIKPEAIERVLEDVKNRSPDIFKSLDTSAYIDEKISISKAAEMLGVTRFELQKEFKEKGADKSDIKRRCSCGSRINTWK